MTARQKTLRTGPLFVLATLAALGLAAARPAAAQDTITFDSLATEQGPNSFVTFSSANGGSSTFDGVTFSSLWDVVGNQASPGAFNQSHSGDYSLVNDGGQSVTLTTGKTLGSLYLGTLGTPTSGFDALTSVTITATGASGDLRSDVFSLPNYQSLTFETTDFAGLSGITGYRFDQVTAGLNNFQADDLTFDSPASAAPEPSSVAAFAFTGLGAAGLILRARKRRMAVWGDHELPKAW